MKNRISKLCCTCVSAALLWIGCSQQPDATAAVRQGPAPVVAGFERFHRGAESDPVTAGRLLLGELGCVSCHAGTSPSITPRRAPRLANVAARLHPERLRAIAAQPHLVKPGTTMPDVFGGVTAPERDAEVEAIVHFLVSLQPDAFALTATDDAAAVRGGDLFARIGCAACHTVPGEPSPPADAVPLPALANACSLDALQQFLREPLAVRPSGRMPSLQLREREARDLAHYLLRGTRAPGALRYTVWHGPLESFDDFEDRAPVATGVTNGFDLALAGRRHDYSLRFDGELHVEHAGAYTFFLDSDDGSRLFFGDELALDNDGVRRDQKPQSKSVARELTAGWHPFAVEFFQRGGEAVFAFEWQGPGIARGPIPTAALRHSSQPVAAFEPLAPDAAQVARGRAAFVARCAACHDDVVHDTQPPSAAALAALDPTRGCLARTPPALAPDYRLDDAQRAALAAALRERDAAASVTHALQTFNCYACHARDGVGGVTQARDRFFVANGDDLGDEGRLPPDLTGVGDRLQPAWLEKVLDKGVAVRPYLGTRMPHYGVPEVTALATEFVARDRRPAAMPAYADQADALRAAGRQLLGEGGVQCILCHDFNQRQAATMHVVDLVTTTERLNEDWFHRFLRAPDAFHPGTRMPAFWPGGRGFLTDVLDGDATRQINALWTYLADGRRAKDPEGLSRQSLELIVAGEALVYRGKLWEAGWRGIAVGHPEQVNLAFDAEQMRLALLWKGRFLDVSAHWRVQGMGHLRPLGHDVRVLPHGAPFAVLDDAQAPWPAAFGRDAGYRFRGYDLDATGRPTFRYEFGGVTVEDTAQPRLQDGRAVVVRSLAFTTPTDVAGVWFRVAAGDVTVRIDGAPVQATKDGAELRVPLALPRGRSVLTVEYEW